MIPGISNGPLSPTLKLKAQRRYLAAVENIFALEAEWRRNPGDVTLGLATARAVDALDDAAALCAEFGVLPLRRAAT